MRVTADTNVIVSGLNFFGNARHVLDLAENGLIRLFVSNDILQETARVLRRPKFGWPEEEISRALTGLLSFAEYIEPMSSVQVVKGDPTDDRIIECALESSSDYLVTGDKHLLALGKHSGIKIVSPAEFVEIGKQSARLV